MAHNYSRLNSFIQVSSSEQRFCLPNLKEFKQSLPQDKNPILKKIIDSRQDYLSGYAHIQAQGTVEYLVIIGIVIVISLVVVGLMINISNQGAQVNDNSKTISNKIGSEGISVVEAISDFDGDGVIKLENTGAGQMWLTKIVVDDVENEYDNISIFDAIFIDINGLCGCEEGMESKTCDFKFYFTTIDNLEKIISQKITVKCDNNFLPKEPPIQPIPKDCFNLSDDPINICTLSDLNRIRESLSADYSLRYDIDASETRTWDNGAGWEPIGNSTVRFTGNFNGNNKIINELYIYRNQEDYIGLFGLVSNSIISNIGLIDSDITGDSFVGGISGYNYNSIITNSYTTGNIVGGDIVGGITGKNHNSTIVNSYTTGNTIGSIMQVGGIAGVSFNSTIINTYATGNTTGGVLIGGITGENWYNSTIANSYSTGNTNGTTGYVGGITGKNLDATITNSYWDINGTNQNNCCGSGICIDCFGKNIGGLEPNAFFPLNELGGDYNVPMQNNINSNNDWNFDTIWVARENNYPVFSWQTN